MDLVYFMNLAICNYLMNWFKEVDSRCGHVLTVCWGILYNLGVTLANKCLFYFYPCIEDGGILFFV